MPTLHGLLEGVESGPAATSVNLQVIPLFRKERRTPSPDYLLASVAFERGFLTVTEVGEGGRVPELRAINEGDLPILFLDGEELVGAKQNRILNTDVLMKRRSKKTIPVSCVEAGRWRRTRLDFEPGGYSPPPIRAKKSSSVSSSLEDTGMASSDQGEVGDEVGSLLSSLDCCSDTMAMADAFDQRTVDLDSYVAELSCPEDAVGVIAITNGQFGALDLFDRPSTLQQVWPRLVAGYATDALARRHTPDAGQAAVDVQDLLRGLGETDCVAHSGVDLGEDTL